MPSPLAADADHLVCDLLGREQQGLALVLQLRLDVLAELPQALELVLVHGHADVPKKLNRYQALIQKVFFDHYTRGTSQFDFVREELEDAAESLGFAGVKNLGDVPYSFRYRNKLPDSILETQPD